MANGDKNQEEKALVKQESAKTPIAISRGTGIEIANLNDLFRFAQYVVASGFAPKGMERPESICIAVEMGLEVGLKPMQAIQNIAVVNGRPTIWGDSAKGLVESSGLAIRIDEWFEGDGDNLTAICECLRQGRSRVVRWEFSVNDAKKAGLWSKSGPWSQYPRRMLQMRARGFALRDAFPDVLKGLYIREELSGQIIDVTPHEVDDAPTTLPRTADELAERLEREAAQAQAVAETVQEPADEPAAIQDDPVDVQQESPQPEQEQPKPTDDGTLF